jgi:type VI protein secretion system component Hcp
MIVARFCDSSGTPIIGAGSSRIERYDGADGWFPIEGFNFGFKDKPEDNKDPGAAGKAPPSGGGQAAGPKLSPGGGGGKAGPHDDFNQVKLSKQVDTATCLLMVLAMRERKSKKGADRGKETKLEADIHILSSVQLVQKSEQYVFTNLMIHLEAVNILGWDIQGSGDSRPTESVSLRYDRAAMIYVRTPDAKNVDPLIGPKGWDQTKGVEFNEGDFNWAKSKWDKYLPK